MLPIYIILTLPYLPIPWSDDRWGTTVDLDNLLPPSLPMVLHNTVQLSCYKHLLVDHKFLIKCCLP